MSFDLGAATPDNGSVCRRLTSLHRRGYVVDDGHRRRGGKNRDQIAWVSTDAGRAWVTDRDVGDADVIPIDSKEA